MARSRLTLALVAMDRGGIQPGLFQRLHQLFRAMLGAGEDQREVVGALREEIDQKTGLGAGLVDEMHRLGDEGLGRSRPGEGNLRRAPDPSGSRATGFSDQLRHGGREKHRLARRADHLGNATQGVNEAQIEHLIGLVQDSGPLRCRGEWPCAQPGREDARA